MSATYDPTLADAISRMRFALGDTNTAVALLPDATYTAVLAAQGGDEQAAAVALARSLIAREAQAPTRIVAPDGQSVEFGKRLAGWQALIDAAPSTAGGASVGGMRMHRPARADAPDDGSEYRRGW